MATVVENILAGKYDKSLTRIEEAIRIRKYNRNANKIRLGSKVRFPLKTRPAYLAGVTATVKEFRRSRMLVIPDPGQMTDGTRFQRGVITRLENLELVD